MTLTIALRRRVTMPRLRPTGAGFACVLVILGLSANACRSQVIDNGRQAFPATLSAEEAAILKALAENPVTAPYAFQTSRSGSRIVLKGVVGTKQVHDVAIQMAIVVTPSIDDRLVIDTSVLPIIPATGPVNLGVVATQSMNRYVGPGPLVYPRPLFGRFNDPFLGFEPPLITYPPWWTPAPENIDVIQSERDFARPRGVLPENSVEMTIDPRGVAVLRGRVPTEEARGAIGEKAARLEGVVDVMNLLEVDPTMTPRSPNREQPPPPPMPDPGGMLQPDPPSEDTIRVDPAAPDVDDAGNPDLRANILAALKRRPLLDGIVIEVTAREGVATLTGEVPTILEAMTAYRAVQQTVGVTAVVDRLRFAVPDGQKPNPLLSRGRPEDVEPYLLSQIRRQIGDQANIDRVELHGDRLEIVGAVAKPQDRDRVQAILRSMAILRGFDLQANLHAN